MHDAIISRGIWVLQNLGVSKKIPAESKKRTCLQTEPTGNIGTVVRTADKESSVLALCTLLNVRQYKKELAQTFPQLLAYFKKHGSSSGGASSSSSGSNAGSSDVPGNVGSDFDFDAAFKKKNVGLLLNERLVNAPPEIVKPLHQVIFGFVLYLGVSLEN